MHISNQLFVGPNPRLEKQEQDESHPYWQEEEAFTYGARSWQPKDCELNHAQGYYL